MLAAVVVMIQKDIDKGVSCPKSHARNKQATLGGSIASKACRVLIADVKALVTIETDWHSRWRCLLALQFLMPRVLTLSAGLGSTWLIQSCWI